MYILLYRTFASTFVRGKITLKHERCRFNAEYSLVLTRKKSETGNQSTLSNEISPEYILMNIITFAIIITSSDRVYTFLYRTSY